MSWTSAVATIVAIVAVPVTRADTIHVCWDGSGDYLTIQAGIDAAVDGDEVVLCDGTYTGNGNRDINFHGKAITVRSESGDPSMCVINCEASMEDPHRGFAFVSGETPASVVDGLTIVNGYVTYEGPFESCGGGVYCDGSSPTITNCTIRNNLAYDFGGGVYCSGGHPTLAHCTITGNWGNSKGGGVCGYAGNATLIDCTIYGNNALGYFGRGGGVCCYSGKLVLTNCTIAFGYAYDFGGGVCADYQGNVTVVNCTISQCFAGEGAAISCGERGRATVANSTISGNWSDYAGVVNCGGGDLTIANCILWADTSGEIYVSSGSALVTYCDVQGGWPGIGNIDADPLFVDQGQHDFHLLPGSPCVDAGCNGAVPRDVVDLDADGDTAEITPLDLDSEGRFFDDPDTPDAGCGFSDIVDMGAYEFGGSGPQPCPGDLDGDRDVDSSDLGILLSLWDASDVCDLNCDGDIDQRDLGILLAHWGEECP